jgi:uncharacterized protein
MDQPTTADRQWLLTIMGRNLAGNYTIATRRPSGEPQVLRVPPIVDGKPFPSLYWLVCPTLKKRIDQLESSGLIKELEELIPNHPTLMTSLAQNHRDYISERSQFLNQILEGLNSEERPSEAMLHSLSTKGIGGLEDFQRVRCLHMHYAYHLVRPTEFGRYLDERFALNALT